MHVILDDVYQYGELNYRVGFFTGFVSGVLGTIVCVFLTGTH